jgi:hypothetical protein
MARSGDGEMPEKEGETSFSGEQSVKGGGDPQLRSSWGDGGRSPAERPELRLVQVEYDSRLGKTVYKDVGAMWRNTSRSGNEFYTLKIGKLKLLAFPNNKE